MFRRAKLMIADIEPEMLAAATRHDGVLVASLSLTGEHRAPLAASSRLSSGRGPADCFCSDDPAPAAHCPGTPGRRDGRTSATSRRNPARLQAPGRPSRHAGLVAADPTDETRRAAIERQIQLASETRGHATSIATMPSSSSRSPASARRCHQLRRIALPVPGSGGLEVRRISGCGDVGSRAVGPLRRAPADARCGVAAFRGDRVAESASTSRACPAPDRRQLAQLHERRLTRPERPSPLGISRVALADAVGGIMGRWTTAGA